MKVRIISWNIWDIPFWFSVRRHERIHQIGHFLREHQADIIALQESFDIKHRDLILKDLGEEYFITEGYDRSRRVFLFKKFDLTGGLVIYSRYPIIASSFEPFGRKLRYGLVERVGRKGFLKSVIKVNSVSLLVINTHLFTGNHIIAEMFRQRQISNILDKLERLRGEIPVFLMGDLNADFEQETKAEALLLRSGFKDSAKILNKNISNLTTYNKDNKYTHVWFNDTNKDQRLDYILVRDLEKFNIRLTNFEVIKQSSKNLLSDHDPVMVDIEVE